MAGALELIVANPLPVAQLIAAILLTLLGAFVLAASRRRAANVSFSAFLFLVAANYALVYLATLYATVGPRVLGAQWPYTAPALHAATLATIFLVFDPVAFLFFAAFYPERNRLAHPAILGGAVAVSTAFAVVNFLDPLALLGPSPWHVALAAYYSGVYAVCLYALLGRAARSEPETIRARQLRLVVAGCAVAVITRIALVPAELRAFPSLVWPSRDLNMMLLAVGILAAAWVGLRALLRRRAVHGAWPALAWTWRLTGACLSAIGALWLFRPLVRLAIDGTDRAPALGQIAEAVWLSSYAMRWVVFGGIVSYALLRYQVFDLDVRLKRSFLVAASLAFGVVAFVAAFVVLEDALGASLTATMSLAQIASAVLAVGLLALFVPLARRLAERLFPGVASDDAAYVRARKLEVYRAAVEPYADGGGDVARDRDLDALRRRLGVTSAEHDVMLAALRGARIARRAPGLARPGDVVLGRYRIESLLGHGATGRTFLARDLLEERDVAVKEIIADSRDGERAALLALREAQSVAEVDHPNVLRVERADREGESFYVVMEYAPGGSLKERLQRAGRFEPALAVRVARDILDGLAEVHVRNVVHRDVKPANVLFGLDGEAKVADFGVARVPELSETLTSLNDRFQPGTPYYMAPEQIEGKEIGASADAYAVAVILYEMLAGRSYLDFRGLDLHSVREHIAAANPQLPLPGVSATLNAVLARGLAKSPEGRFTSAAVFAAALADTPEATGERRGHPPSAPPPEPPASAEEAGSASTPRSDAQKRSRL